MTILKYTFAAALFLSTAHPAYSISVCARYEDLKQTLSKRYQEKISAYGLSKQKDKVEIFVSKSGTFTILATRPDGLSCILAVGDNWELELKNLTAL
jgi:hypothetical protein